MGLPSQLERINRELADALRRAHETATPLTAELWSTRPAADQWSVADCLIHLNLTSRAFFPLIRDAISRGRDLKMHGTGPFRRDVVGWFVYQITEPPVRFPVKTTAPFVPTGVEPKDQEQLAGCVREADGLDLGRLRITSPFDPRLRYNLYSCLRIITGLRGARPPSGTGTRSGNDEQVWKEPRRCHVSSREKTDVTVREITIAAGGSTGWHYHDGQVIAVVKSGTLTRTMHDCSTEVTPPGGSFVEPAGRH